MISPSQTTWLCHQNNEYFQSHHEDHFPSDYHMDDNEPESFKHDSAPSHIGGIWLSYMNQDVDMNKNVIIV